MFLSICLLNFGIHLYFLLTLYFFITMDQNNITLPPDHEVTPKKNSETIGFKVLFIIIISLCLLICSVWIFNILEEREDRQENTITEISDMWSGAQSIAGPIIELSYLTTKEDNTAQHNELYILPSSIVYNGNTYSRSLTRGIYDGVVYNADIDINGTFDFSNISKLLPENAVIDWKESKINIYVTDLRGIEATNIIVNGKKHELTGNHNVCLDCYSINYYSLLQSSIDFSSSLSDSTLIPYNINLSIKGSQSLAFAPIGKSSEINISGDCDTPSFCGMFLPSEREVTKDGFKAQWVLNAINRDYPQSFTSNEYISSIKDSEVIANLLVSVDTYQKTSRALKYAIIVILLTFIGVLFAETMYRRPIYVFQYLLIGIALILFYTLLLSLAEHINFGYSYIIAASATIMLISLYLYGVVKLRKVAIAIGLLLSLIYCYIFILLSLETFALLAGSIGLFVTLAFIMYASLKMDWKIKN